MQAGKPVNNLLGGDFDSAARRRRPAAASRKRQAAAGAIGSDRVVMAVAVVPSKGLDDNQTPRKTSEIMVEPAYRVLPRYTPGRKIVPSDEGYVPPGPPPGANCLKLEVRSSS